MFLVPGFQVTLIALSSFQLTVQKYLMFIAQDCCLHTIWLIMPAAVELLVSAGVAGFVCPISFRTDCIFTISCVLMIKLQSLASAADAATWIILHRY